MRKHLTLFLVICLFIAPLSVRAEEPVQAPSLCTMTGTAIDQFGQPLAGAKIRILRVKSPNSSVVVVDGRLITTQSNGTYSFTAVIGADYWIKSEFDPFREDGGAKVRIPDAATATILSIQPTVNMSQQVPVAVPNLTIQVNGTTMAADIRTIDFGSGFTVTNPSSGRAAITSSGGGGGAVSSVFGRTGAVTAQANDYSAAQISGFSAAVSANSDVAANTSARHTHANKSFLDLLPSTLGASGTVLRSNGSAIVAGAVTASEVTGLDAAVSANVDVTANTAARHTHANKAILDTITYTPANVAGETFTGRVNVRRNGIGTAITDGLFIDNTTAATSGAPNQNPPTFEFRGNLFESGVSQLARLRVRYNVNHTDSTHDHKSPQLIFERIRDAGDPTVLMMLNDSDVYGAEFPAGVISTSYLVYDSTASFQGDQINLDKGAQTITKLTSNASFWVNSGSLFFYSQFPPSVPDPGTLGASTGAWYVDEDNFNLKADVSFTDSSTHTFIIPERGSFAFTSGSDPTAEEIREGICVDWFNNSSGRLTRYCKLNDAIRSFPGIDENGVFDNIITNSIELRNEGFSLIIKNSSGSSTVGRLGRDGGTGGIFFDNQAGTFQIVSGISGDDINISTNNTNKNIVLTPAGNVVWGKPLVSLGGGSSAALGTIGGSGPATATQNSWMQVKDSDGNLFWVPVWK